MSSRVIFLDRDGVINRDSPDFIRSVDDWLPIAGSLEAIANLTQASYRVIVITNQSGVGRGLFTREALEAIHEAMNLAVEAQGGRLAGVYACLHRADENCRCRKPRTGLVEAACSDLGIDSVGSPFVGDRPSDWAAARAAGCRPIAVQTGSPLVRQDAWQRERVPVYQDLREYVDRLLWGGGGS